ncbi:Nse4 C-terminal-domain-containing protein [Phycomyces nitens]|nr:Nse4 C-terminal-domain-containing protein [Phycomyces nitens]
MADYQQSTSLDKERRKHVQVRPVEDDPFSEGDSNDEQDDDNDNEDEDEDDDEEDEDEDEEEDEDEDEDEDEEEREEEDPGYIALVETLEKKTDREKYDPNQDKDQRRVIRQSYRTLIKKTKDNRRDFMEDESLGLYETLSKANDLYQNVRNTQEASLDSKLLVLSADIGAQKARNMRLEQQLFNLDEFVSKLKTIGRPETSAIDNQGELNWKAIGMHAIQFGKRAHSIDFMLGPLSVEKKQRKAARQGSGIRKKHEVVQPTQLKEDDVAQKENETSNNVNQIYRILDEQGPSNYFEFIVNPDSFSQSVENMFYVSFLIRNAVAEIDDSSGQPILSTRAPPTAEDLATDLRKKQIIMNLDIPLWKEIINTYGIQCSIIPTRPARQVMEAGKWY